MTPRTVDRSRAPERTPPAGDIGFPEFRRESLTCGTRFYRALTDSPLVGIQVILAAGAHADPPGLSGLASFTADLLEEGTRSHTSEELAQEIEGLGASLHSGAGWSTGAVSLSLLEPDLDRGLELLGEIVARPAFDGAEIDRLRRERLAQVLRRLDQPAALGQLALVREIYGDSPYGGLLAGDKASLEAITRDDIVGFYARRYSALGSTVIAVGDLESHDVGERLAPVLSALPAVAPPLYPEISPAARSGRSIIIVDRPDAAQTDLRLGHAGPPRRHADHSALTVLNSLLGGKFTSRINLNLRERHGFTYGAQSGFADRLGPGPFIASAAVDTEAAGTATRELIGEIERIRDEPASDAEIADTVSFLRGVFPYGLQTSGGILQRLQTLAVHDLPDDYWTRHFREIEEIDADRLQCVAESHLKPEAAVVVAVGPASSLAPQLEALGDLRVLSADSLVL